MQSFVAANVYPAGASAACRAVVDAFACAVTCSPYQPQWTSRDPLTLGFIVAVAPATCAALQASCGLQCSNLVIAPNVRLALQANSTTALDLTQLPPFPPAVVALGSAASYGLDRGGLVGPQQWQLVTGNQFELPVPVGGASVTLTGSISGSTVFTSVVMDSGNGSYTGSQTVTLPGHYTVSVQVNGSAVANSLFHLTYVLPTPCLGQANLTVPTFLPPTNLNQCGVYASNACCDANLVATLRDHWIYLAGTFGPYPPSECTRQVLFACARTTRCLTACVRRHSSTFWRAA